jgi:hypothetical protein
MTVSGSGENKGICPNLDSQGHKETPFNTYSFTEPLNCTIIHGSGDDAFTPIQLEVSAANHFRALMSVTF